MTAQTLEEKQSNLLSYIAGTSAERARQLADPAIAAELAEWLGSGAAGDLAKLPGLGAAHLAAKANTLLFVPGIMGSMLSAQVGGMWWVDMARAHDKLNGLALTPDGLSDLDRIAGVAPSGIDVTYEAFARAVLMSEDFELETLPYDWRQLPSLQAERLRERVHQLYRERQQPIHLVAHSMGGLVIRAALMAYGEELWPEIGKIVFLATPHYGCPAIAGYLKNHLWGWEALAVIGAFLSRDTFRSLWGALSLLPAPVGVYPDTRRVGAEHPCGNFDFYRASEWKLELDVAATQRLQRVLDGASGLHRDLYDWHSNRLSQERKDRMLVIAGVGYQTLFRLEFSSVFWGLWEHTKRVTERAEHDPHREGDGRVTCASAELEDVTVRFVRADHGSIPNVPAVIQDVFAWLGDQPLELSTSRQGAVAQHLGAASASNLPHVDGSASTAAANDVYDRYRDIPDDEVQRLAAAVRAGTFPNANLARLL